MSVSSRPRVSRSVELEHRVSDLEARVESLEALHRPADAALPEVVVELPGIGAEYWLGARLLPRLGAVIIVLAIAFIAISESSRNASVDRWVLLALEGVLCVAFIAVGEWRRDELEGFGRTLTAIGSCGLYLTAAGGHFAYHTLTSSAMAMVFAGLSIANHAYAVWRNTRLFFAIGATGGLAAMLFPLAVQDYGTGLAVYATVTVAGAVVCAFRKWLSLAFVGWVLGIAILTPVMDSDFSRAPLVLGLYLGSFSCIAALTISHRSGEWDLAAAGSALMFLATASLGLSVIQGPAGLLHLAPFGLAGIGVSRVLARENRAATALRYGSVVTVAALAPLCFGQEVRTLAYVAYLAILLAIAQRIGRMLAASLAAGAFVAAVASYLTLAAPAREAHLLVLAGVTVGIPLLALALRKACWRYIDFTVLALWLVLVRWAVVLAPRAGDSLEVVSLPTVVTGLYAMGLLYLGFHFKSGNLRLWSMGVMFAGVIQILVADTQTTIAFRLIALLLLGGMMLFAGFQYVHAKHLEVADQPKPRV